MNDPNSFGNAGGSSGSGIFPSMVEFLCQSCSRKLRVSSGHIGRSAKCPQCGHIQPVPGDRNASVMESPTTVVIPRSSLSADSLPAANAPMANGNAPSPGDTIAGDIVGTSSAPTPSVSPFSRGAGWPAVSPPVSPPLSPSSQPSSFVPQTAAPFSSAPKSVPGGGVFEPPSTVVDIATSLSAGTGATPVSPLASQRHNEAAMLTNTAASTATLGAATAAKASAPSRSGVSPTATKALFDRVMAEIGKIYVGQDELVVGTLVALFSNGHVLIESVPGLGKTLFVRTLGRVLGLRFGRIQFTADLMPSDITGAPLFDMKQQEFRFRPGPVFTQLLLADEINRAPAKTHAALLEIMQEFRVTVDGSSHTLEKPFLVLATQNPIESEGTYNLPEAQLDRFMFKLMAGYPDLAEEKRILEMHSRQVDINRRLEDELGEVTNVHEILETIRANGEVIVDERLVDYVAKLVRTTRVWPQFHMGASPRAGLAILQAARTLAAFHGRDYAVPDDVAQIAIPALRHRVILTAEAEVEGRKVDEILRELIRSVEVPRL